MAGIWLIIAFPLTGANDSVLLLGRCPVESASVLISGNFLDTDREDIIVIEKLGQLKLSLINAQEMAVVPIFRLVLLTVGGRGWEKVWCSPPMIGQASAKVNIKPHSWTAGDVDGDSVLELLIVQSDSWAIVDFRDDITATEPFPLTCGTVLDVACADIDLDSTLELITLEQIKDSLGNSLGIRVWRFAPNGLAPGSELLPLPKEAIGLNLSFLGACRLEDYPGLPVLLLAEHPTIRPSVYAVLFSAGIDSFAITTNPFPYEDWFKRDEVLPAGRLVIFNIGDTLIAYGYFVPGARPGGPKESFAFLSEAEWHLLEFKDWARRLSGQICPFNYQGKSGFLELRERTFYFYPDVPFYYRH